ncbi:aldehyde dehydrogenase family protein [Eoetvoesiella caeni]
MDYVVKNQEAKQTIMPRHFGLYYGGQWHDPVEGRFFDVHSPATAELLAQVAEGGTQDADLAVQEARKAFETWSQMLPQERARRMKALAQLVREHADELAMLDALDGGNPVREMTNDVMMAAAAFDYFAGLVTEMKGSSVPAGVDAINFSIREPLGVVVRIVPFNHPFMFCMSNAAAPLAAGNAVIVKPPAQAPLSSLRLAELAADILPAGVLSILNGGNDLGAALVSHPDVAMVGLIGSAATGRAVMRACSDTLKPVLLELGGKNALIAYPDVTPESAAQAAIAGMNFTWCGQSCGSTSRAFIHESIYDQVLPLLKEYAAAYKPGLPTSPETTMGAINNRAQYDRVLEYIRIGKHEATLLCGGDTPRDASLSKGFFVEPTIFVDVDQSMRIANEEIFGPVLSVIKWRDEEKLLEQVNAVQYGLTCSIWTNDLVRAHKLASRVQTGFVWLNETSRHFIGAPFGGYKQSGIGRTESIDELLAFTQLKHIHVNLKSKY